MKKTCLLVLSIIVAVGAATMPSAAHNRTSLNNKHLKSSVKSVESSNYYVEGRANKENELPQTKDVYDANGNLVETTYSDTAGNITYKISYVIDNDRPTKSVYYDPQGVYMQEVVYNYPSADIREEVNADETSIFKNTCHFQAGKEIKREFDITMLIDGKQEHVGAYLMRFDYDERGNVVKMTQTDAQTNEGVSSTSYEYLEYDEPGNWVKRRVTQVVEGFPEHGSQYIQERKIEYNE